MTEVIENLEREYPVLPLRGLNIFPDMVVHFDLKRKKSVAAVNAAMKSTQELAVFCQKQRETMEPEMEDLYPEGTLVEIRQITRLPNHLLRVLVQGKQRVRLKELDSVTEKYDIGTVELFEEPEPSEENATEEAAMLRVTMELIRQYAVHYPKIAQALQSQINSSMHVTKIIDRMAMNMPLPFEKKQEVLSAFTTEERYEVMTSILARELKVAEIQEELAEKIKTKVEDNQRDFILREQLSYIRKALNGEDEYSEPEVFMQQVDELEASDKIKEKIRKEIRHFETVANSSSESAMERSYIETLLEMPWDRMSEDNHNLAHAKKILDKNHYGMDKVKERILEFLAVRALTDHAGEAPILCLVGAPGTGKTSIAKSVAEALNKNYQRICLGGVRDEAEIRGHRKTYVGAMMGQVANALRQAAVKNPLILLDEIDKVSNDYRGDTFSALLEVLDPDQNSHFRDHYVELPVDLSQVLFIATANTTSTIPRPLLDRMEIIEVSGYTENEKFHIAKEHLLKKQYAANGMNSRRISITDKALKDIIRYYTREAGVRELERKIGTVCRKAALQFLTEEEENGEQAADEEMPVNRMKVRVNSSNLESFLGKKLYSVNMANRKDEIGIVRGLAWTVVGGETLQIEVNVLPGGGDVELTGQMGDVMQESAKIGYSYIRSVASRYHIRPEFFKKHDLHIHIPEGAVPKDGPSAGITMATAMFSAITKNKVDCTVAMTGEITLRGKILPIGGLKEKLLAAKVAGIKKVLVPDKNKNDVLEISSEITDGMEIVYVSSMEEVLSEALQKQIVED